MSRMLYSKTSQVFVVDDESPKEGFLDSTVSLTVIQSEIEASDVWKTSDFSGSFSFCLSTSLYLKENNTVVTQRNIMFNANVNNHVCFELSEIDTNLFTLDDELLAYPL